MNILGLKILIAGLSTNPSLNISWPQIAGERIKREIGVKVAIFDPAFMSKEFTQSFGWGEVGHADEIESSHMWYCYPDLVKMDRAKDNPHNIANSIGLIRGIEETRCAMSPVARQNRKHWFAYPGKLLENRAKPPRKVARNIMNISLRH